MGVIVTGGAGFLGSHLTDRLVQQGEHVIVVDDLCTGDLNNLAQAAVTSTSAIAGRHSVAAGNGSSDGQKSPSAGGRVEVVEGDVCDAATLRKAQAKLDSVEAIYHLASRASPPAYRARPIATLRCGSQGTLNALEVARSEDAMLLLASTSEIYGDPQATPQHESYRGNADPVGPRSMYDEAKRFAESLTMAYHRRHGLDVRIARIFNTYGPRLSPSDGRVVSNFLSQALEGRSLTVYGDGKQTRSFCYAADMIHGIEALATHGDARPVNLGNPQEMTILELAEAVRALFTDPPPITWAPLPEDDPKRRRPDVTRAKDELGWAPEVPLEEGLQRTLSWLVASRPPQSEHRIAARGRTGSRREAAV